MNFLTYRKEGLAFLLAAGFAAAMGLHGAEAALQPKSTICHFPPGNPANVQVISVGAAAVPAHVSLHHDAVCAAGSNNCCFGGSAPSVCTNFGTDANNCGGCGVVCDLPNATSACSDGACTVLTCDEGFADCNGSAADGCETSLATDPNNCGDCGMVCASGEVCTAGECTATCPPGQILCDGECVDAGSDPHNCGGCSVMCPAGQVCTGGVCTTNPSPECQAATCDTFVPCNTGSPCSNPVCVSTAEGGGLCVEGGTACSSLAPCVISADCQVNEICAVQTCCVSPVCIPVPAFCPAP